MLTWIALIWILLSKLFLLCVISYYSVALSFGGRLNPFLVLAWASFKNCSYLFIFLLQYFIRLSSFVIKGVCYNNLF